MLLSLFVSLMLAAAPADLILEQARIYTVDPAKPWAEAVAIKDGRIVYVGDAAGVAAWAGPRTVRHRLDRRLVLPGLVDAHTHPGHVSSSGDVFLLPDTRDRQALLDAVAEQARRHPESSLLVGGYWPIAAFDLEGPRKEDLDRAVADRPVILFDDSGHSRWLNSKALQMMGIDRNTPDPVPGLSFFKRDANGESTGWAKEFSLQPYLQRMGFRTVVDKGELKGFLDYLVSKGVTLLLDAGNGTNDEAVYSVLAELERAKELPLRYEASVHITLPGQVDGAADRLLELRRRFGGARLRFNTVKIHFDGVSEIGTSSVLEPFLDSPRNHWRDRDRRRPLARLDPGAAPEAHRPASAHGRRRRLAHRSRRGPAGPGEGGPDALPARHAVSPGAREPGRCAALQGAGRRCE